MSHHLWIQHRWPGQRNTKSWLQWIYPEAIRYEGDFAKAEGDFR